MSPFINYTGDKFIITFQSCEKYECKTENELMMLFRKFDVKSILCSSDVDVDNKEGQDVRKIVNNALNNS